MSNNWAIVVGINQYKFLPNAPLKFAVADALAMQSFLSESAGFKPDQILLCGDGRDGTTDATRSTLRDILLHQIQRANGADNLWFFFSGHGIADHLMTIDGNPRDLEGTAISIHFVTDCLRDCKAKNIVLILDMCRNENHDAERKSVESIEESLRTLVKEREGQQGIVTLFSCGRGESSYEIADLGQGAFTYALLEGLRSQTIVKDLESYLERRVPELNEAADQVRKQVPLVIPEPGWKYDQPILSHYAPEIDVSRLKEMAIDAECDGEFDRALQLWEQVNISATKTDDRRRALNKIRGLRSRSATNQSPAKPIAPPPIIVPLNKVDLGRLERIKKLIDEERQLASGEKVRKEFQARMRIDTADAVRISMDALRPTPISKTPIVDSFTKGDLDEPSSIVDPIPPTPLKRGSRSLGLDSFEFETCQLTSEGVVIQRQTRTAPYFRQDLGNGVFIDMVVIPGGKFRNIQIPGFCMAKTLITQAQWEAVAKLPKVNIELESSPSRFKGTDRPVEKVNWWMAEEFCKRLAIVTKRDYRLPAEAQWEYACRSGTTTDYHFGDTLYAEVANYADPMANYGYPPRATTEVAKYPANAWGLYDMHGNLWEWCADHWSDKFETALKDSTPIVSSKDEAIRVIRGGSWFLGPHNCASSYRLFGSPTFVYSNDYVGLRVVCSVPKTLN